MPTHQKYFHVFLGAQKNCYLFIILKKQGLRNKRYASNVCLFRIINTIKPKSISNRKKTHKKYILRKIINQPSSGSDQPDHSASPSRVKLNPTQLSPTQPNSTQLNTTQPNTTQHSPTQPNTTQFNTTQLKTTQSPSSTATLPPFSYVIFFPLEIHFRSVCL